MTSTAPEVSHTLQASLRRQALRQRLRSWLEEVETPAGRIVNLASAGLVLISAAIFIAETYPIPSGLQSKLHALDLIILTIFVAEYLLRLWCAQSRIKYLLSFYSVIDLIAILPSLLGFTNISFIRILRWFRILMLLRFLDQRVLFGRLTTEDSVILARIIFTVFAIVFVYSGLIYQVEELAKTETFHTFLDAFYFSIVTMTTVGFGDITPQSEAGRLMTVLMILTGITLIPWQIQNLIRHLFRTANQVDRPCRGCGLVHHQTDALFCRMCGTKLAMVQSNGPTQTG